VLKHCVLLFVLSLVFAVACSQEPSEVFVPGPSFSQSIRLATEHGERATVRVEQPLVLHAQRSSGPWVAVARASLPPDACWLVSPPAELEVEVAGNLRWLVEPPGAASFNVELRLDFTREVRFSRPGSYQLSADSQAWCRQPFSDNTLTVEVVDPST
jgi:hypothetical protein